MNDQQIEQEIQAKGLTAPRVTLADVEAAIEHECYSIVADAHRFGWLTADHSNSDERDTCRSIIGNMGVSSYSGTCLSVDANTHIPEPLKHITICVLILRNGFKIVGVNEGPASPENFDAELGRTLARKHAVSQIWPLLGYALKQELHRRAVFDAEPKTGAKGGE